MEASLAMTKRSAHVVDCAATGFAAPALSASFPPVPLHRAKWVVRLLLVGSLLGGTAATAQATEPDRYLAGPGVELVKVLPPAPERGSPRYDADRRTFRETRKLLATPRGTQAVDDVREDVPTMLADFSEAVGRSLTPDNAPALAALLTRMHPDVASAVNAAKNTWRRQRPFLIDRGATCQPRTQLDSYDYPSGHTTWGTSVALVLAELIPDRATEILARGRAYGDSRYICGAHNMSAVEGGRLAAASIIARLHGDPAFRRDLDAARRELGAGE